MAIPFHFEKSLAAVFLAARIASRTGEEMISATPATIAAKAQTGAKVGSSVKTTNSAAKAAEVYTEANPTAADGRFFSAGTPLSG